MLNYIIVTPARDEAEYIQNLIFSVKNQTVKPKLWIIVDDGSTDNTVNIVSELCQDVSWCRILKLPNRGFRQRGAGVINAFNYAYKIIQDEQISSDLIAKIDADISFDNDVFEKIIARAEQNPRLGIFGGSLLVLFSDGIWKPDRVLPPTFVRGAMKIYRRICLDEIGGLVPHKGWDGIDVISALTQKWDVLRFDDIFAKHHRSLGYATGPIKASFEDGIGAYFMGSIFFYMLYEAVQFAFKKPYIFRGMAMISGYIWGWIKQNRLKKPAVISYIQAQQKKILQNKFKKFFMRT